MMVGITDLAHQQFLFQERFLPSLIVNSVFMILFAYLTKITYLLQNRDDVEEKINERKKEFRWQRWSQRKVEVNFGSCKNNKLYYN
ncbi:hypothetical protein KHA80_17140 [Anaerobacillus sp. HL2]|nr:hypothetical protein KHA80_17140 [Anaerobacillus sp. HL2]